MSEQDAATALSIGCVANKWLTQQRAAIGHGSTRHASTSTSASVVAVFDRCLYVAGDVPDPDTDTIDVSCIGTESIGRGGLNVVTSSSFQTVLAQARVGDPVSVDPYRLCFSQQQRLSLVKAPIYHTQIALLDDATVACQRLRPLMRSSLPPGLDTALFRGNAIAGVRALSAFLDNNVNANSDDYCNAQAGEAFHELLGLGAGLTPAGDDFLTGVLIALRSLNQKLLCRRLGRSLLNVAARRTNRISAAHLRAAADGQCAEALVALLSALVLPDTDALPRATARLSQIGQTSGRDALCGVMFTLQWASARA